MLLKKLIIGLLSFYAYEFKNPELCSALTSTSEIATHRVIESRKKRETEKKKARLYDKRKWKKKKIYVDQNYRIKGTNPKDARFSNQQKLRRMYRST